MYIGIDLGGTNIAIGLCDVNGKIVCSKSIPTPKDPAEIIKSMALLSGEVVESGGYKISDVKAVGIGCPGTINTSNGTVVYANNIAMDHVPMTDIFRTYLDLPVNIENDANAAAFGEYVTCGENVDSFIFITLGTGVGGGVITDGKLLRGFNYAGGEIGHFTLIYNGEPCTCGQRGCFESYASVTALIRQTKEAMKEHPESMMHEWVREHGSVNGRTSFSCAALGDKTAIAVRDQYIEYVAAGICSTINIFQPQVLAIGGGISREGSVLLDPIKEYLKKNDYNKFMPKTELKIATLFGDAGIVGAAMLAKQRFGE
ncbi:MAG: ROK family protein [Ruminococcaceae bacterium]|nr:ROK family protein [Oscillospiraceae bacterium]